MLILRTLSEIREEIQKYKSHMGEKISLIPTMGFLHEGHLSLIREAKKSSGLTIVTIFVNKLQFNDPADYKGYPTDEEGDFKKCESEGADIVFAPSAEEIYGAGEPKIRISIKDLGDFLCGKFRPGHFEGVLYIVMKFFNIIQPDRALFGRKDYQQYRIIKRMAEEMNFPVEVIGLPTVREDDGLAMSSRNVRLSKNARDHAGLINRALKIVEKEYHNGNSNPSQLAEIGKDVIESGSLNRVEYFEIIHPDTLQPFETQAELEKAASFVAAAAVFCDGVRLIDNLEVNAGRN